MSIYVNKISSLKSQTCKSTLYPRLSQEFFGINVFLGYFCQSETRIVYNTILPRWISSEAGVARALTWILALPLLPPIGWRTRVPMVNYG